jgi:hypothetical protein
MQKNTTVTMPLTESWFNIQNTFFHDKHVGVNHRETGSFFRLINDPLPLISNYYRCAMQILDGKKAAQAIRDQLKLNTAQLAVEEKNYRIS